MKMSSSRSLSSVQFSGECYETLGENFISRGYKYIGNGRHRAAFLTTNGRFVVKIPINEAGEHANHAEYRHWRNRNKDILAKCRLFFMEGIPCIIMEKVEKMDYFEKKELLKTGEEWILKVDQDYQGFQVGRNRKGKVVAWDYTDPL
jgi:hypothetical protein